MRSLLLSATLLLPLTTTILADQTPGLWFWSAYTDKTATTWIQAGEIATTNPSTYNGTCITIDKTQKAKMIVQLSGDSPCPPIDQLEVYADPNCDGNPSNAADFTADGGSSGPLSAIQTIGGDSGWQGFKLKKCPPSSKTTDVPGPQGTGAGAPRIKRDRRGTEGDEIKA